MNKYIVTFEFQIEIEADSKQQAERFAIEDYKYDKPKLNDMYINIKRKEL
tara:strand:- start:8 stop:157 length:150 start_codon:yes stop_codon:yes gene_type:complete